MHPFFRAPHAGVARSLRSARLVLCLVALAAPLATGAAAPAATSARSATPGTNGHLLVASGHRHEMGLFAMQPRSGDRLLLEYGGDQGAAYSPDGTKIAFMNNYDGDYEICVMNADGTGTRQLTKNSSFDGYPGWSPDGTKIAFTSNRDGDLDIWVMNADASEQTNITSDDPWNDDAPRWSPDGRWIAIETDRYGGVSAELITPDGTRQATIGSVQYATWFDSWSPDGKSLLVDSNRLHGNVGRDPLRKRHDATDVATRRCVLISDLSKLLGREAFGEPNKGRPKAPMNQRDLSADEPAHENLVRVGHGSKDRVDVMALWMRPPAALDVFPDNRFRKARRRPLGRSEDASKYAEIADSVRDANAVPIWHATIPANVAVVASR